MSRYHVVTWLIVEDAKGKRARVAALGKANAQFYKETGDDADLNDMLAFLAAARWWIIAADSVWRCYRVIDGERDKQASILYQWDRR